MPPRGHHGGGRHGGGGGGRHHHHHHGGGFGAGPWWGPGYGQAWDPTPNTQFVVVEDDEKDREKDRRIMAHIMTLPKPQRAAAYMKFFGKAPSEGALGGVWEWLGKIVSPVKMPGVEPVTTATPPEQARAAYLPAPAPVLDIGPVTVTSLGPSSSSRTKTYLTYAAIGVGVYLLFFRKKGR